MHLHEGNRIVRDWKNMAIQGMAEGNGDIQTEKEKSKRRNTTLRFRHFESCHEIKGTEQFCFIQEELDQG